LAKIVLLANCSIAQFKIFPNQIMKFTYFLTLSGLLIYVASMTACKSTPGTSDQLSELLAPEALNTYISLAEFNYYEQGDSVFAVGLVDNQGDKNCRPLIAIEYFDGNGQILPLKGTYFKFTDTVYAHNRAVPGRGRTSFMYKFPKKRIVGQYASVKARPIGADLTENKTAIIFESQGFYKRVEGFRDPQDTSKMTEKEVAWIGSGNVLNPFNFGVGKPLFELHIYRKDSKLCYSELLDPDINKDKILINNTAPMSPSEKRAVSIQVMLETMPRMLQDSGIGRIDVQAFQQ
jgi:hypothetical protein